MKNILNGFRVFSVIDYSSLSNNYSTKKLLQTATLGTVFVTKGGRVKRRNACLWQLWPPICVNL